MSGSEPETQTPRPPNPPWRRWIVRAGLTIGAAAAAWLLGSAPASAAPAALDGTPDASPSVGAPAPLLSPTAASVDTVVGIRIALAPASGIELPLGHDLGGRPPDSDAREAEERSGPEPEAVTAATLDSVGDAASAVTTPAVTTTAAVSHDLIDATTMIGTTVVDEVARTTGTIADTASSTVAGTVTAAQAGLRHAASGIDDVIRSAPVIGTAASAVTRTVSSIVDTATEAVDSLHHRARVDGATPAAAASPVESPMSGLPDPDELLPQERPGAQPGPAAVEILSPPAMPFRDVLATSAAPVTTGSTTAGAGRSDGRSALPQVDLRSVVSVHITDILGGNAPGHPLRQPALPAGALATSSGTGSASSGQNWVACAANTAQPREDSVTTTAASKSPAVLDRSRDPGFSPG